MEAKAKLGRFQGGPLEVGAFSLSSHVPLVLPYRSMWSLGA